MKSYGAVVTSDRLLVLMNAHNLTANVFFRSMLVVSIPAGAVGLATLPDLFSELFSENGSTVGV